MKLTSALWSHSFYKETFWSLEWIHAIAEGCVLYANECAFPLQRMHWRLDWGLTGMHLFPRVDPSLEGYLEPWESRTGLGVVVTPPRCGGCQVPDWRRRWDSSKTSMLTAYNHLSAAVSLFQAVAQGVAGMCFVPNKHLAACRQDCIPHPVCPPGGVLQPPCAHCPSPGQRGLSETGTDNNQCCEAPSLLLIAHFHLHRLCLPSTDQSPQEETEAGAFTVSILKMKKQP